MLAGLASRWLPPLRQSAWALADQWLFSGANFIANILLARWLNPHGYGAFAFAFSLFLLFAALHTAVLADPLLVFGAGRYRQKLTAYLRFSLLSHLIFSVAAGGVLLLASALTAGPVSEGLLAAAISLPFILLAWLLRRTYYISSLPQKAALFSAAYLILLLGGIAFLEQQQVLTASNALFAMGAASLLVSLPALLRLLKNRGEGSADGMLREQLRYARWSGPTSLLIWVPLNLFIVALPYFGSLAAAAELRAISNLLTPAMQSGLAITVLLLPQLSVAYQATGADSSWPRLRSHLYTFLAAGIAYWLLLFLLRAPLLSLLYADQYAHVEALLLTAGLIPIPLGIGVLFETGLRALEQPRRVFFGYLAAAIAAATLGLTLTATMGAAGAVLGQLAAFVTLSIALGFSYRAAIAK